MIIPLSQQIDLVVYSFLAGMLTGLLFDIYRIVRGFGNPNKFFTVIEDTLFWIFSAIVIFIFLLYTNFAHISMYVYMWLLVGIFIYTKFISRYFLTSQRFIILKIVKILRVTGKVLFFPWNFTIYAIKQKIKENRKIT
jgi:spore cortex biosynthesis protein YabQ